MTCREGHSPRHPDFAEGNTAALKAGHRSPRVIDPIARDLIDAAVAAVPLLTEPAYTASLTAWARAEAQAMVLTAWLEQHGWHDEDGRLRPAEQALHRAETRAATLRRELGLTPVSQARLLVMRAAARADQPVFDLAQEMARIQAERPQDVSLSAPGGPVSAP